MFPFFLCSDTHMSWTMSRKFADAMKFKRQGLGLGNVGPPVNMGNVTSAVNLDNVTSAVNLDNVTSAVNIFQSVSGQEPSASGPRPNNSLKNNQRAMGDLVSALDPAIWKSH